MHRKYSDISYFGSSISLKVNHKLKFLSKSLKLSLKQQSNVDPLMRKCLTMIEMRTQGAQFNIKQTYKLC